MANLKKKPTIREVASSLVYLKQQHDMLSDVTRDLEKAFSMYITMKKDDKKFSDYIDKKVKEWRAQADDAKANGEADKPNLQGDTDGESSGTEGVRQEAE